MKKQKFNGKLRLKKNVISNLSAHSLRGGDGSPIGDPTESFCIPTDPSDCPCISHECTLTCPPGGETQNMDCHTGAQYCMTELTYCCL